MPVPPSDRKFYRIGDELYRMDQQIQVAGRQEGYDGTGPYWVIGHVQVLSGSVTFIVDEKERAVPMRNESSSQVGEVAVTASHSFLVVMPPHSVVSVVLDDATTVNHAALSRKVELPGLPAEPFVAPVGEYTGFHCKKDVEVTLCEALLKKESLLPIARTSSPDLRTLKIKDYLSETFQEDLTLADFAQRVDLAPEVLSRLFKKDWGKSPIHFRNWLRVIDSFRLLMEKEAVIETAFDSGFNDVSRFNKQFKQMVGYTPSDIRKRSV